MRIVLCAVVMLVFFAGRGYAQEEGWQTSKSTHFVVYYRHAPEDFLKELVDTAEDYYNRIADGLGFTRFNFWLWDARAKVYLYDNGKDYQEATGQPAWAAGHSSVTEKSISTFVSAKGFFDSLLPHEMGHIIFREFVGFYNPAVPLWLDEGIASYQQKSEYLAGADTRVRKALQKGEFPSLETMRLTIPPETGQETVQLFYAGAFSIVRFLIQEHGKDAFVSFCQHLKGKKVLDRALASAYPYSTFEELEESWKQHLLSL